MVRDSTYGECLRLMGKGNDRDALKMAGTIEDPAQRAGILIDAGYAVGRPAAVRQGISIIESLLSDSQISHGRQTRAYLLYNLANGHMSLFQLRSRSSKEWIASPNDDDMRSAKTAYRKAINALQSEPDSLNTQLWVNYGNCLSLLGRGIEAIQCYEEALLFDENNGMALGNLGIELEKVARISGRYIHDYLRAASTALEQAMSPPRHLKYGAADVGLRFREVKDRIERYVSAHGNRLVAAQPMGISGLDSQVMEYIKFCQEKRLFLNAWVGDPMSLPACSDELAFPPIITPLDDEETVPELLEILNEIKESYATARYLYFLSLQAGLPVEGVSSLTNYFSANGFRGRRGIRQGCGKTAYVRAFDVLDKIARIINVYFKCGKRDDSFWRVLVVRQSHGQAKTIKWVLRPNIANMRNPSLLALGDLAIDHFETQHVDLHTIDRRRNRLTHDYLIIRSSGEETKGQDDRTIHEADFQDETLRILKIAKQATLYVVSAISIAERMAEKGYKKTGTVRYEWIPGE